MEDVPVDPLAAKEVAIDIEALSRCSEGDVPAEGLHVSMMKRVGEVPGEPSEPSPVTIFRLPSRFHEKSKELCEPKMVSIGPFHHGKENLRSMEEYKWSKLRDFLLRNKNVSIENYLEAMRSLEAEARQCYSETVNMKSEEFVMMLLLDGCFILEWFSNHFKDKADLFWDGGWIDDIFSDICLLENQLPFFVIHKLKTICDGAEGSQDCHSCGCLVEKHHTNSREIAGSASIGEGNETDSTKNLCPLLELTFEAIRNRFPFPKSALKKFETSSRQIKIKHLLHFYYEALVGRDRDFKRRSYQKEEISGKAHPLKTVKMRCVTVLQNSGITFKKIIRDHSVLDVRFKMSFPILVQVIIPLRLVYPPKLVLKIPHLSIQIGTLTILRNMVAFEQSYHPWVYPRFLSSYLHFMNGLIKTEKDVAALEQLHLVENFFPTTEDAANFFNQISNSFSLDYTEHYFYELFKVVNHFRETTWWRYKAILMQNYFGNPWSIISVVVGAVLLILTFLQTLFSAPK